MGRDHITNPLDPGVFPCFVIIFSHVRDPFSARVISFYQVHTYARLFPFYIWEHFLDQQSWSEEASAEFLANQGIPSTWVCEL